MGRKLKGYKLFGSVVLFLGLIALAATGPYLQVEQWQAFLLFLLLGVAAEALVIPLPYGTLSLGFVPVFAAFWLLGGNEGVWVAFFAYFLANTFLRQRETLAPVLTQSSRYALAALTGWWLYSWLEGVVQGDKFVWGNLLPALAFIAAYFLVNHLLMALCRYPALRKTSSTLGWAPLKWDMFTYLFTAPAGAALALFYQQVGPVGSFLLFLPFLTLKYFLRLYIELEMANRELAALHRVAKNLGRSLNLEDTLHLILKETTKVVPYHTGIVFLWQEETGELAPAAVRSPQAELFKGMVVKVGEGVVGWTAKSGEPEIVFDSHDDPRWEYAQGVMRLLRSLVALPLTMERQLVGVMVLGSKEPGTFEEEHLRPLAILSGQAAISLSNALLFKKLENMAATDGLTKVYNHRYFYGRLEEEARRARRYKNVFSLVMVDVDHFKAFNDRYGHPAGDAALAAVAQLLRQTVRQEDLVARYGGEEFAVLLLEAGPQAAVSTAERIRRAVEERPIELPSGKRPVHVTVSVGVATFHWDTDRMERLVELADQALYRAKKEGRNRVCSAGKLEREKDPA